MLEKYLEILRKCPLFFGISDESMIKMLGCLDAKVMNFDKKCAIFSEGSPAKHIGIVLSGVAQVTQTDYYGNRSILNNIGTAEVFAEAFACAGMSAIPVTVTAGEPCRVMLIECDHILHTCANNCAFHQQLIYNLIRDLAMKTVDFHRLIEVTSKRTTREKLLTYLMIESKRSGSTSFDIPYDRQELADYLEVDRSGLSAEISKLRREGILESKKRRFTLL